MSASPIARQCVSHSQVIPTKKVVIHDSNQLPDVYSSTPNGTLFSTTPGGKSILHLIHIESNTSLSFVLLRLFIQSEDIFLFATTLLVNIFYGFVYVLCVWRNTELGDRNLIVTHIRHIHQFAQFLVRNLMSSNKD